MRLSYPKNTNGSAEVLEENNFYPFGLKHEGYNVQAGNPAYNYQYNGKELQKETGWSDYGARMYMADIARWGVIDPLAEQMRRYSPYNYAYNNPIRFIDPDGRKPQTQEDEIKTVMYPGTMLMFYASGGSTNNRALMQFVGQPDNIGDFFVAMDKLNSVNSKGGGGGGSAATDPTPKNTGPGIIERIGNFFSRLFGKAKSDAKISTFLPGATITRASLQVGTVEGSFETALNWEKIIAATGTIASGGRWLLPLMLNGDSSSASGYDVPLTGATDVPADETGNLYLYRTMRNVGGMPMVGEGLDKLGLRDRDVNNLSNTTMITPLFENGLSVTIGYGNITPSDVPDFSRGKGTLFRIPASSLISYGLVGLPVSNPNVPNYGQIRPAVPMNIGTFRALIQSTAPAWQPVK